MRLLEKIPLIIVAACVLHNLIIMKENIDDEVMHLEIEIENDNVQLEVGPQAANNQRAAHKREMLVNLLA